MMPKPFIKLSGKNHTVKETELIGFSLTESVYPANLRMPRHTHSGAHISFIFQGSYTERHQKQAWECKTYTLVFHPFGLTHSLDFDDTETRIFTVEVKPRWIDYVCEKPEVLNRPSHFYGGLPVSLASRLFYESRHTDAATPLAMEGLILEMIAAAANDPLTRSERNNSRWCSQAKEILHAHFAEHLTIENIAKTVDVHPAHLARAFRQQTGCTIGEYLRRLRVEFASNQLASTEAALCDVAAAAGFSDQSHFSRTFKSYIGVTPGEYRKIIRQG